MKPILATSSVVRNFLNVEVNSWPARPIDSSKPFQWQDRRPIKKCADRGDGILKVEGLESKSMFGTPEAISRFSPFQVGDVLYIRETFVSGFGLRVKLPGDGLVGSGGPVGYCIYKADDIFELPSGTKWRPSIHMPKDYSRIHLEVMRVRVERACDISEEDAKAEGCDCRFGIGSDHPLKCFNQLWQSLYGPDAWEKWVFVYDLKRVK
jgi:hypothetical protein